MDRLKPIYLYSDYRDFLSDRLKILKTKGASFSFQACAKRMAIEKTLLIRVTQKKRHFSIDKLAPAARLLKLDSEERQYLIFLFLLNTSKEAQVRSYFRSVLSKLKHDLKAKVASNIEIPEAKDPSGEYLRSWLGLAMMPLVSLPGFKPKPDWIAGKLGLNQSSFAAIEETWKRLLASNAVVFRDGRYETQKVEVRVFKGYEIAQEEQLRATLFKATESLGDSETRPQIHQNLALALSEGEADAVVGLYQKFISDALELIKNSSDESEKVFFLSNHFFPVSK